MPKVDQQHLDARRQQIVDAARTRFARQGFARTSMADVVAESGLSTGAIYRYFAGKDELVVAVCEQADEAFPTALTEEAVGRFLEHVRALARDGHARLTTQVFAEAALSPGLAEVVRRQLAARRAQVVALLDDAPGLGPEVDVEGVAEAFVAVCSAYNQQLAVRGDVDPAPYRRALIRIVGT
jgi:AcrR family transcriptional regulator